MQPLRLSKLKQTEQSGVRDDLPHIANPVRNVWTIAPILWLAHEFLSGAAIIGKLYGMAVGVRVPKLVRRD